MSALHKNQSEESLTSAERPSKQFQTQRYEDMKTFATPGLREVVSCLGVELMCLSYLRINQRRP